MLIEKAALLGQRAVCCWVLLVTIYYILTWCHLPVSNHPLVNGNSARQKNKTNLDVIHQAISGNIKHVQDHPVHPVHPVHVFDKRVRCLCDLQSGDVWTPQATSQFDRFFQHGQHVESQQQS